MIKRIQRIMYGRYGIDELYSFLFKIYLCLFIINIFIRSSILSFIEIFIVFFMFYRVFSKNIYKRSIENRKYLGYKKKIIKYIDNIKDKDYVYRKCFKCHTVLRLPLPYNMGIKKVKCPKCGNVKRILVFKKQKIEIIK